MLTIKERDILVSNDTIVLKVSERKELGKAVKALRRAGFVPANMYEKGKESVALSAPIGEITKVYHAAGKHSSVELDVEGKKHLAMIRDIDIDPVKGTLRHVGFHAVKRNQKVEAEVPVRIDGEIPGQKLGLLFLQNLDTVQISALPANLPEELLIDGAKLAEEGDKVTVADLKVPEGVEVLTDSETMVADLQVPRDQIAEADAALEETKGADEVETEQGTDETKPETEATEEE